MGRQKIVNIKRDLPTSWEEVMQQYLWFKQDPGLELIQSRHPGSNNTVPIFCSTEGTMLNRHTWGDRLEMYSERLGVSIRPYDLRHAFALQFLRNGGHALAPQRTLGHTDLSMTKRYVALTQQDVREHHTLASPLNALLPQRNRVRKVK